MAKTREERLADSGLKPGSQKAADMLAAKHLHDRPTKRISYTGSPPPVSEPDPRTVLRRSKWRARDGGSH